MQGEFKGVELFLLPSRITTWQRWQEEHPHSTVMTNGLDSLFSRQGFDSDFVVGVILEEHARAYYYEDLLRLGALNDILGPHPILLWAAKEDYQAYLRQVGDRVLTFEMRGKALFDRETGSLWDGSRGLALEGELTGAALRPIPSTSAFDWAWQDFYPDALIFKP